MDVLCITPTSMEQSSQDNTSRFVERMERRVKVPMLRFRLLRFGHLVSRPPHASRMCCKLGLWQLLYYVISLGGGHRATGDGREVGIPTLCRRGPLAWLRLWLRGLWLE